MSLGPTELLVVLAIVLLIFGSTKIPQLARSLGEAKNEFQHGSERLQLRRHAPSPRTPSAAMLALTRRRAPRRRERTDGSSAARARPRTVCARLPDVLVGRLGRAPSVPAPGPHAVRRGAHRRGARPTTRGTTRSGSRSSS